MSFRDILRTAGYTLLTFSLVVALALIAKNDDIFLDKDVVAEEDTVNPNYNAENVTKTTYEDETETYHYEEINNGQTWGWYYEDSKDNIGVKDELDVWQNEITETVDGMGSSSWDNKRGEYFTDSSNEAQENASSISLD